MKIGQLNLRHVVTFYLVAKEGSFSAAAERLYLTEPAVSLQIKSLEKCIGVKLFKTKRGGVCLTNAGEALFPYAEQIYKHAREAENILEMFKDGGLLHVGVAVALSPVVTKAAGEFKKFFPSVKIKISSGPSYQIVEELLDVEYDMAIVPSLNYQVAKLQTIRISSGGKLVLVTSPSFPLPEGERLRLLDLRHLPFILPCEGSATREFLLKRFRDNGVEIRDLVSAEGDYLDYCKKLAETGRGITLMLQASVEEEVNQGKLKMLPLIEELKISVDVLTRRDMPLTLTAKKFIAFLKETF